MIDETGNNAEPARPDDCDCDMEPATANHNARYYVCENCERSAREAAGECNCADCRESASTPKKAEAYDHSWQAGPAPTSEVCGYTREGDE